MLSYSQGIFVCLFSFFCTGNTLHLSLGHIFLGKKLLWRSCPGQMVLSCRRPEPPCPCGTPASSSLPFPRPYTYSFGFKTAAGTVTTRAAGVPARRAAAGETPGSAAATEAPSTWGRTCGDRRPCGLQWSSCTPYSPTARSSRGKGGWWRRNNTSQQQYKEGGKKTNKPTNKTQPPFNGISSNDSCHTDQAL